MRSLPRLRLRNRSKPMTVIEHLEELRSRAIVSLVAVAAGSVVGWFLFNPVFHLLLHGYCTAIHHLPKEVVPPTGCKLIAQGVVEPFLVRLKVAVFTGLAFALPVLLYELWAFIVPGLTRTERRLALPFVFSSVLLFALGAWFAYLTLPKGLQFLLGFAGNNLVPLLTVDRYLSFVLLLVFAFGIAFEFPLVLIFLAWVGITPSSKLRRWRRMAILLITIFAAVATPSQDPYTQLAMMVPMIVFYELAIVVARLLKR